MPRQDVQLHAMNRGEISPLALGRTDIEPLRLAAETFLNFLPKALGPMAMRTGLKYRVATETNNAGQFIEFIAGTTDTALLVLTASKMRVMVSDAYVTRVSVATAIANGTFATSTGWIDASTNGATLTFDANGLTLNTSNAGGLAKCTREIAVAAPDQAKEHGLKIVIPQGFDPVYFRCGSVAGDDNYVTETRLLAGQHHLAFTMAGASFFLTFWAKDRYGVTKRVTSIAVEAAGAMEIVTPWGAADLGNIQYTQSADVVFVACADIRQMRIERRSTTSWSVVDYRAFDGPFVGKTAVLKLKPSATNGRPTLTADQDFFKSGHDNALFRIFHDAQIITMKVAGNAVFTDPIRVSGVQGANGNYNERAFAITTTGTWVATLKVQRSVTGADVGFGNYPRDASAAVTEGITTNTTYNNEDYDDNLIVWYRVGINDGDYTSGEAAVLLTYNFGGDFGIVRVVVVDSATQATVEVLRAPRGVLYTAAWSEGAWSDLQGYPTAVALHEGRLLWFAGAQIWGSVSDDYESFDQENINDDGPIIRTIGEGPVDAVNWAMPMGHLMIGTAGAEIVCQSSTADSPLTPTNFSLKPSSNYGSKTNFRAIKVDESIIFVDRSGNALHEIGHGEPGSRGHVVTDLTLLHPKILSNGSGVVSMAVQRRPNTRIHCVLSDGTVAIITYDKAENISSWSRLSTGTTGAPGVVERVAVLSDAGEDKVYYLVKRTIGGATKRYVELFATEAQCEGGQLHRALDSYVEYNGVSTTSITGLDHLEAEDVYVWADGNVVEESDGSGGFQPKAHTVASGAITLATAATKVIAGLGFTCQWKSVKLAYAAAGGSALMKKKVVHDLALLLGTTHHRGLKAGRDFTNMYNLGQVVDGATVASGTIHSELDEPAAPFAGDWDTDSRVCLQAVAPYPVTVKSIVFGIQTSG